MDKFISELMDKMTLREKLGQLNLPAGGDLTTGAVQNSNLAEMIRKQELGGFFNVMSVEKIRELQRIAVEETRLGIPLVVGADVIHGYQTIFPIPLALACSWDTLATERMAQISAKEATANGIAWTFSPMVDICRDARWGRIAEAILRLPEKRFWVITDAQSYKGATLGIKLLNGIVKKSETIAEMADGMGIPAQTLERTINEYNRCVRDGFDPVFRKDVFAQEIRKPPFYWGEEHIYVHTSFDGIATDPRGSVVYKDGRPIPGLFAAGEVVGGIFGRDRLGGGSLANCFVIGRLTGERAAQAARLVAAKEEAMRTRLGG